MPAGKTVAVFGAGASMASGGIGLDKILDVAFSEQPQQRSLRLDIYNWLIRRKGINQHAWMDRLKEFLHDVFGAGPENWPDLGLVLSLVDHSISRGEGLVSINDASAPPSRQFWPVRKLPDIREKLEGAMIAAVLDRYVAQFQIHDAAVSDEQVLRGFVHELFLDYLYAQDQDFRLISMNYDMFLERAAVQHLERHWSDKYGGGYISPSYDVEFCGADQNDFGPRLVHKVHGSLDWAHCSGCGRIWLLHTGNYINSLAAPPTSNSPANLETLADFSKVLLADAATHCDHCRCELRPMIIAPTLLKNYANTHIRHVWSHAEASLRSAEEIYFIGYSLPPDDFDFIAMLKRHTQSCHRDRIHVINPDEQACTRYKWVFGPDIDISREYLQDWIRDNSPSIRTFDHYRNYAAAKAKRPDCAGAAPVPAAD